MAHARRSDDFVNYDLIEITKELNIHSVEKHLN